MLPQSHFTAFFDINYKHFSNALRDSSVYVFSCIYQPVAKELDKIHFLYAHKFCRPTSCRCLGAKSLLGFDWTCAGVQQKRVNIKCANIMAGTMTSYSTAVLATKSILQILHIWHRDFHMLLCRENFTSKWWLWSRVEARNFIKNKLLKLNENRLSICRFTSELNYSEKNRQKNGRFMDDRLKTRGIKYLNIETCLLFAPPSKFLATRLPLRSS